MQVHENKIAISALIEQHQQVIGSLTDQLYQINTKTKGTFIITRCYHRSVKFYLSVPGFDCLFFINIKRNKNRILVGYLSLHQKLFDCQIAFQQFVENYLLIKSSYLQPQAIEQIEQDQQGFTIHFKKVVLQNSWILHFNLVKIAENWQEKLKNIVNLSVGTSQNSLNCSKIEQNRQFRSIISKHCIQTQLKAIIGKYGTGSKQQIQQILTAVMQMSQTPVYLTLFIISKIRSAVMSKQHQIKALQSQLQIRFQSQRGQQQADIKKLQETLLGKTKQCEYLQVKLKDSFKFIDKLKKNQQILEEKLNEANEQKNSAISKLKDAQLLISKLRFVVAQNSIKLTTLGSQLVRSNQTVNNQKIEIQMLIQQNRAKLEANQAQIRNLSQNIQLLNAQIESFYSEVKLLANEHTSDIFQGKILRNCLQAKHFLCKQIQKCSKRFIKKTNLIYSFDINKIDLHQYIDEHTHICLVIRLQNGILIGGYSQDAFSATKPASKAGVICSLTSKNAFRLFKGRRSVTYDAQFLIFGNNELRIKMGQLTLESNFAASNGYYDSHDKEYTALMGNHSQRVQRIQTYQIFEVQFI